MIWCEHCLRQVSEWPDGVFAIPMDPIDPVQLIIFSETGPVPYCGIDNRRALAAAESLIRRFVAARVASGGEIVPGDDYLDERWRVPHLVLAGALAYREERFCVAQWCKDEIMEAQLGRSQKSFGPTGPAGKKSASTQRGTMADSPETSLGRP